ncbi:hypothetical protein L227DRAFT_399830 [Lentinus tigrinus ALCF2SS1-6]|uniref:Uncharacterized protein n=1 Tax=Lentinus tigrinus ALCF2SS1-6 TaxID=1328759 RepID=A0A5C2RSJ5_9APHY|nr:hypothetical protein L227DRAFT_399830 [Lentinus tigrinus ALCF2SS1-6]
MLVNHGNLYLHVCKKGILAHIAGISFLRRRACAAFNHTDITPASSWHGATTLTKRTVCRSRRSVPLDRDVPTKVQWAPNRCPHQKATEQRRTMERTHGRHSGTPSGILMKTATRTPVPWDVTRLDESALALRRAIDSPSVPVESPCVKTYAAWEENDTVPARCITKQVYFQGISRRVNAERARSIETTEDLTRVYLDHGSMYLVRRPSYGTGDFR